MMQAERAKEGAQLIGDQPSRVFIENSGLFRYLDRMNT
jgi:hypothetical protein